MGGEVLRMTGITVIASAAKQSMPHKEKLDCFVALLLAMTEPMAHREVQHDNH